MKTHSTKTLFNGKFSWKNHYSYLSVKLTEVKYIINYHWFFSKSLREGVFSYEETCEVFPIKLLNANILHSHSSLGPSLPTTESSKPKIHLHCAAVKSLQLKKSISTKGASIWLKSRMFNKYLRVLAFRQSIQPQCNWHHYVAISNLVN